MMTVLPPLVMAKSFGVYIFGSALSLMLEFLLDSFGQLEMSKSYNKQTHVRNDDIHTTFSLFPLSLDVSLGS